MSRQFNGKITFFFLRNGAGHLGSHMQQNKVGPLPHTVHKINSKWINSELTQNIKAETKAIRRKTSNL